MRGTLGRVNLGFFAVFTVIASGCVTMRPYDPGPGKRVAAAFVQDTFLSGESVNVTISNLSDVTLYYPDRFCKTVLQKMDGSEWKTVSGPPAACSVALGFLDPGQTVVHQYRLPQGVAVGTYRLTMPMPLPAPEEEESAAAEPELQSPTFKVQTSSPTAATGSQPAMPTPVASR
jgi:hypothetical protein